MLSSAITDFVCICITYKSSNKYTITERIKNICKHLKKESEREIDLRCFAHRAVTSHWLVQDVAVDATQPKHPRSTHACHLFKFLGRQIAFYIKF